MLDWLFGRKKDQSEEKPKKKKPQAEQEAQDKWKYDFVVQFLSGPLWKTSILDFIDYHCVVFDSEEQNKFEYTTIHNKFKQMVGSLFDGMTQQVGLDDDQLAQILEKGFSSKHKKIFAQLLLVDDFLKFKTLMVNRNKALQAQAIKAMYEEQNPGASHAKVHKSHPKGTAEEELAMKQSILAEKQRQKKIEQEEEEQLRKALQMSKIEAEESAMIKKLEQKAAQKEVQPPQPVATQNDPKPGSYEPINIEQQSKPAEVGAPAAVQIPMPVPRRNRRNVQPMEPLPPVKGVHKKHEQEQKPLVEEPKRQAVIEEKPVVENPPVVEQKQHEQSQEDRKRRLMEQRERIRRKKEEERKKQMEQGESKPQVQTIVLQEDGIHETNIASTSVEEKKDKVSNAELERRRELMKKIKNRIVDDF